ncbi:MAG: hypothetical protein IPI34_00915 [bacterium]|nr:hypothetical protein [bacterium]
MGRPPGDRAAPNTFAAEAIAEGVINTEAAMKILERIFIVVLALIADSRVGPAACAANPCGYDLTSPDAIYTLPAALREISALTYVDPVTLVCVEDEHGVLYTYNPATNLITAQKTFGADGDYEGIARVAQTIYVLRSDGRLIEIADYSSAVPQVKFYNTGYPQRITKGSAMTGRVTGY